jgi:transcriptional regulator with XRE-family HTH domain
MALPARVESPHDALRVNLVVLRATKGLSQQALAERTGVSRAVISELEQGRGDARLTTLARLANGLGVAVSALVEPWRPQPPTDAELSRRARDDEFIDADAFLAALDEADRIPRYSRRGRRAEGTTKLTR